MGDVVAPSPQKKSGGKRRGRKRPQNAVKHIGKSKKVAAVAVAKHLASPSVSTDIPTFVKAADPRRNWIGRTAYAALDLGTNNCRLLIAKAGADGFTVVDAFSRVVRLGEGLNSTGKMSDEAMDRAIEALSVCADKLKKRNVVLARSVATEACRQAVNGAQFIERVKRETGIHLDIISPKEEARLAVMGCHALLEAGLGPALIFDIGGGSTELVLVSTDGVVPEILDWVSVPWGVVSLTESESFDQEDAGARLTGYDAMRAKVSASFAEFASRLPKDQGDHRLLGTSGTVTTLASVYLKLRSYDRSAVDGLHLPTTAMREISQELASLSPSGRAAFPTIGNERADLVVAGCAILEAILDIWPGERLGIADRGIREGILRALMASDAKRRRN
jgi:exopolyphosphatase / guanosine-5'-triphosphate,3'-diphosphate pyrophosphatase